MQIVIVGCGNVGGSIARSLSKEGHDVTIVDNDIQEVKDLSVELDVMAIEGNGSTLDVLIQAGVQTADLLIATTESDEKNILCCLLAKKAGTKNTIARVRNPEYKKEIDFIKEELGLSMSINPELSAAAEIARLLKFPTAIEIDTFAAGKVELLKFEVTSESPLSGMALKFMHKKLNTDVLVCIVERGTETLIPNGEFVLSEGDKVSVIGTGKKASLFFKAINLNQGKVKNCMIVGGGETSFYLSKMLIQSGVDVKIIERDKKRCEELAEALPEAIIINGDGSDKSLLGEEGIESTESFVSLSNHDEENVMMSIYAKKVNPKAKLVTKVHRSAYEDIIGDMNLGSIINPKFLTAEEIVKYVRAMSNTVDSDIEALYQINQGKAEALEFIVKEASQLANKPLSELNGKLKPNVIIASIIHKGMVETPNGSSKISEGDRVVVVTTESGFSDISDILE